MKKRVLSISVMFPVTIALIWLPSATLFTVFAAVLILFAAWEWAQLMELKALWQQLLFCLLVSISLFFIQALHFELILPLISLTWASIAYAVFQFPQQTQRWHKTPLLTAVGCILLSVTWLAIITLRNEYGPMILFLCCLLVWLADVGAYLTGKCWGKRKLVPQLSPGKTLEGLYGALALVALYAGTLLYFQTFSWKLKIALWLTALAACLISVMGDLSISMLKRVSGVKDTGRLIPGHGGVLDRIDSLLSTLPFLLGLFIFYGAQFL